ncbi:MAG: DUF1595 domain-containing protein, partial [Planctomycetota bacterium]
MFLDEFSIEGPLQSNDRAATVLKAAEEGIDRLLHEVLPRAFRRPISEKETAVFNRVYQRERAAGVDHETAVERMLVAVLMSPNFLFVRPTGNLDADRTAFWSLTLWGTPGGKLKGQGGSQERANRTVEVAT